jgi:hypothetical protein
VLPDVLEHPSDVKFIIREIIYEDSLITCDLLHTILIFVGVFLILAIALNLEVLSHLLII